MKKIATTLIFFISLACSRSDQTVIHGASSGPGNSGKDTPSPTEICTGETPPNTTLTSHLWKLEYPGKEKTKFIETLSFQKNFLKYSKTCFLGGVSATVVAQVPYTAANGSFTLQGNDSQETTISNGSQSLLCKLSLEEKTGAQFSFKGPCLQLQAGSQISVLKPADPTSIDITSEK